MWFSSKNGKHGKKQHPPITSPHKNSLQQRRCSTILAVTQTTATVSPPLRYFLNGCSVQTHAITTSVTALPHPFPHRLSRTHLFLPLPVAGHNLDPTPWHLFPPKDFAEQTRQARNYKIIQCSYLTCPYNSNNSSNRRRLLPSGEATQCPQFFQFIHRDLEPWSKTGIRLDHLEETKKYAAFRVVIHKGKLYLDLYYACVQSRMMFTIWGLLQMLNKYPGLVPDVDMMFECMDKPSINMTEHQSMPLPLFRYCTTEDHFDIPFPDWSFWGWPEVNVRPWNEEFKDIKQGSKGRSWLKKWPLAFWKGNPYVDSPIRTELLECNDSRKWGAQIMQQNWDEEARAGYQKSKLSSQCDYRYKIYAEGFAWSVSLKCIISCGSLSMIISPRYEEFLSRGLIPRKNYWPVSPEQLCPSIKSAVDWGNSNPMRHRL